MIEESVYFKVKRSNVHITDDALKMWGDSTLAGFKESNGVGVLILGILLRIAVIVYFIFRYFRDVEEITQLRMPFVILVSILLIINLWQIVNMLRFNYTNNIPIAAISHIEYKKRVPLLRAGHIVVHFEKNGSMLKRPFIFSGWFESRENLMDALRKLKAAGLYHVGNEDEDLLDS